MATTERDVIFLKPVWRYFFANVIDIAYYSGVDKTIVRNRVQTFMKDHLIRCSDKVTVDRKDQESQAPVYVLTVQGSCELARLTNDASYILRADTSLQQWQSIPHYRKLTVFQMRIDKAIETQSRIQLTDLTFEHKIIDPKAKDYAKKFYLYQRFEGGIICIPDVAFVLRADGLKPRVFFVELETGAKGPQEVWEGKWKGLLQMHLTKRYQALFPGTHDMRVVCACPHLPFLKSMREEMKTAEGELKPGANLWLLVDINEIKNARPEELLTKPIFWKANGDHPLPLVPPL
jgi:hypothetical protein